MLVNVVVLTYRLWMKSFGFTILKAFFPSYRPCTPIDACNAGSERTELHTYHDFERGSGGAINSERVFEIASFVSVDDRRSSCINTLVQTHMTPAQISTVLGLDS